VNTNFFLVDKRIGKGVVKDKKRLFPGAHNRGWLLKEEAVEAEEATEGEVDEVEVWVGAVLGAVEGEAVSRSGEEAVVVDEDGEPPGAGEEVGEARWGEEPR